jgi:hypothetical protein
MVVKLRNLLSDVPHTEHTRQRDPNHLEEHNFKLRRALVTDMFKRARLPELTPEEFVLLLSPDQRLGWLSAMIDAEGSVADGFTRVSQNDGPVSDAIKLAVYLEGWRPTRASVQVRDDKVNAMIGMARPRTMPSLFQKTEVLGKQPVWCVSTELGSWTMQQADGSIMLTGNSVGILQVIAPTFDAYAGPYRNVGPFLDGVSVNAMANMYAGINYAKAAYGADMAAVIGHGHGYASGTMGAQRGWAWVGERGPELAYFHGGEKVLSHEQSIAAMKSVPGVGGYYAGTNPNLTSSDLNEGTVVSMRAALSGVESQLTTLIKATKGVGSDSASALNSTSRGAGNRGAWNTRGY